MGPGEALGPCPSYTSTEPRFLGADPRPPPYSSSPVPTAVDNNNLPPDTLLLTATTIHSASISSPRIYELSHHIGHLSDVTRTVTLCRIDYRPRNASSTNSDVVGRPKPIFTLTRPPPITTTTFEYYMDSTSRGNLGDVCLAPYRHLRSSGYRAYLAARPHERADLEAKELLFVASARGHGRYDWREGSDKGRVMAYESNGSDSCRLQIVVGMQRGRRDALVGSWCLRLWHEVVDSRPRPLLPSRHRGTVSWEGSHSHTLLFI